MNGTNLQDHSKLPLALARAALTEADWRFLRIVHLAGGYVLGRQAVVLGLRPSRTATYQRLRALQRLGFLASVPLGFLSPPIYKLTARALGILGDRDAHVRRAHAPRTILYKLLRLQFISEQHRSGHVRLALSAEKQRAFFETHGFAVESLPRTGIGGHALIGQDAEHLYVYHIDRFHDRARRQLRELLAAYRDVLASDGCGVRLIVVVPTAEREHVYRFLVSALARRGGPAIGVRRVGWWPFGGRRQALVLGVAVQ